MKNDRRVPLKQLMNRLGVSRYEAKASYTEVDAKPAKVKMLLKQHAGVAAESVVSKGDPVKKGELIAQIPPEKLGANIHASIDGRVSAITDKEIVIERV